MVYLHVAILMAGGIRLLKLFLRTLILRLAQ